ncbi:MAG: SMP-30/gluconolactonase/LRE family protein [Burkholderiales bacterium]|nr:SMP-30/gluconolactonase/LRE family protein [Burkholderiales bacterium]MDE1928880.1 SMP-30/gluconolactonase/LRE family protein [Burkholderiales bacterium]MDE2158428.1 SMP-30/gluconolactonase/LRE family protein [Burkholderiales bacterium]MDE2503839.1 SMP-30/gluconolactonase/LRE family protein [Burkholderiales bacterium]
MNVEWTALPAPAALLGESPFWHPDEAALYWCDIPGRALHRWHPGRERHDHWDLEAEPGCCAPLPGGELLLALRNGIHRFDPRSGRCRRVVEAPYDPAQERFNDGKADPQGRLWVGTIYEPRQPPRAALYCWPGTGAKLRRVAGDVTVSNGLAFSPDGATLYWSDTTAHRISAYDYDGAEGTLSRQRVMAEFPLKQPDQDLVTYGGRPDGAAVDAEGAYWVAMFEGQRLLRLAPDGRLLQAFPLPVRCPTMVCFGGADLRTLYVTTARNHRSAAELAAQPLAGRVLAARVEVAGLPVHFARG